MLEKSAFSVYELIIYDQDLDNIRTEITFTAGKFEEGKEEGKKEMVLQLKKLGVSTNVIMQATGLSENEINDL